MKIVFGSDLHGSVTAGQRLIEAVKREDADMLILCGDIYYHGPRNPLPDGHAPMELAKILNENSIIIRCARGNCDSEVDAAISDFLFEDQIHLQIHDKKLFVTHGHIYNKNNHPPCDFDIMIYGHFHISALEQIENRLFASPGSPSLPKCGCEPSYLLLTKDSLTLKTMDGKKLTSRPL